MKQLKKWLIVVIIGILIHEFAGDRIRGMFREIRYEFGEHTGAEEIVKAYADANGLSLGDYPRSLIALLERNPETREFVLEYPLWENPEYDLSEFENTDSVPLFLQWDQRWGYTVYGSDLLAITGCGPTCLAMVGWYLTGDSWYTPDNVAKFSQDNGYYVPGNGSSWTLISQGAEELGLDVTEIPLVKKRITDNLEVGNPIICAMGEGDFTDSGHYIVLTGLENGKFRVNDPNSIANSQRLWSYEELEDQIRNIWVIRK